VIYIDVPTEQLIQRVAGRFVCPTCATTYHAAGDPPLRPGICDKEGTPLTQRNDDRPEVVRARLDKQVPPMLAVLRHYEEAGIADRIDGTQPIELVTEAILRSANATPERA
ncbi:MAG: adenylate kinase family protein, partial [Candidatus Limnocylindria bacterium]